MSFSVSGCIPLSPHVPLGSSWLGQLPDCLFTGNAYVMEAGSQSHAKTCENLYGSCMQGRPRSVRILPLLTILQQHGKHQNKGKLATTYFPRCTIITEGGKKGERYHHSNSQSSISSAGQWGWQYLPLKLPWGLNKKCSAHNTHSINGGCELLDCPLKKNNNNATKIILYLLPHKITKEWRSIQSSSCIVWPLQAVCVSEYNLHTLLSTSVLPASE